MKKIITSLLIIALITFCLGELAFRFFKPMPVYSTLKQHAGGFYKESEFNTFTLLENYSGEFTNYDYYPAKIQVTTNSRGFRNTIPSINSEKKILILGDSYTFGIHIKDENTYSSRLSKLINRKHEYEVINAGYANGFETDQQYSWFSNFIKNNGCPEIVILGFFLGNDFFVNQKYWKEKNNEGFPIKYIDENLYVDSKNFLRSKKKSIHTIATEAIYQIPILRESHLLIAVTRVINKIELRIKGIGSGGWSFESFKFIYGDLDKNFLEREKIVINLINDMNQKTLKCKSNFITILLPISFMVNKDLFKKAFPDNDISLFNDANYYDRLEKKLINLNINTLNIFSSMKHDFNLKGINHFPNHGEVHFNSHGHNFTAEQIFNYLLKNKLIN
tara:strand:+ start:618 stop:1787 length:1170 start_codon:yes stop_codon:yes gene_type:complete